MNEQIPYCPICQESFLTSGTEGFALSCNHIYCNRCVWKVASEEQQVVRCYFDGAITPFTSVNHLVNLKAHLTNIIAQLCTMRSSAQVIDQLMQDYFALPFTRAQIPCKVRQCRNSLCQYDHSNRYYKKTECPFSSTCPNYSTCIFLHPWEVLTPASLPPTPKPGGAAPQAAMFSSAPPGFYDQTFTTTYQRPNTLPFHGTSQAMAHPALPVSGMPQSPANSGQYSQQCPYCFCYSTVCRCQRPNT